LYFELTGEKIAKDESEMGSPVLTEINHAIKHGVNLLNFAPNLKVPNSREVLKGQSMVRLWSDRGDLSVRIEPPSPEKDEE
jgi:hypothetical protein